MRWTLLTLIMISLLLSGCVGTNPSTPQPVTDTPPIVLTPASLPTPTTIPTPIPKTLYVKPSQSLGPISPLIYGSNYGPWLLVSVDMLQAAYDSGVTILRFPAGSWGDQNNVTPLQIDQFMDFANKLGATASFDVRLLDGTP